MPSAKMGGKDGRISEVHRPASLAKSGASRYGKKAYIKEKENRWKMIMEDIQCQC